MTSLWPRICPVCRLELPERGNRRVYVPWCRGFRLVHDGDCFRAIDAQGVLDLEPKRWKIDPRRLLLMRRYAQLPPDAQQAVEQTPERRITIARLIVASGAQALGRDEGQELLHERRQQRLELARRALHDREVSAPRRTEAIC